MGNTVWLLSSFIQPNNPCSLPQSMLQRREGGKSRLISLLDNVGLLFNYPFHVIFN